MTPLPPNAVKLSLIIEHADFAIVMQSSIKICALGAYPHNPGDKPCPGKSTATTPCPLLLLEHDILCLY